MEDRNLWGPHAQRQHTLDQQQARFQAQRAAQDVANQRAILGQLTDFLARMRTAGNPGMTTACIIRSKFSRWTKDWKYESLSTARGWVVYTGDDSEGREHFSFLAFDGRWLRQTTIEGNKNDTLGRYYADEETVADYRAIDWAGRTRESSETLGQSLFAIMKKHGAIK